MEEESKEKWKLVVFIDTPKSGTTEIVRVFESPISIWEEEGKVRFFEEGDGCVDEVYVKSELILYHTITRVKP